MPDFGGTVSIMKKNLFIALFVACFAVSIPNGFASLAQNPSVVQAQNWLDNLKTAKSRFEQIDYQGNVMRGTFYINRPGRLRFEYDAPTKDYIVADGVQIHFFDGDSQQVNSAPIGSTLADFILRDGRRFDESVNVKSVNTRANGMIDITVEQVDQPGSGELTLNFSNNPFVLKSWQIKDAQGLITTMVLQNFDRDTKISPSLFTMNNRNLNQ